MKSVYLWLLLAAAPAMASDPEFTIRIHQHRFQPSELKLPAGVKVRIVVYNDDEAPDEFDSYVLHREKHVQPKSKATLFLGPLDPGRYPFRGEERNGIEAASGVLIVR